MDDILKQQLEMYERGDIDALEQILTSTMSQLPQDDGDVTIVSEAVTVTPSLETNHLQEEFSVAYETSNQSEQAEQNQSVTAYPALTQEIKEDISKLAKEWIRLDEGLHRIRKMKREFEKEKKLKNQRLLEYIEKYGLKDITKGRHQLVPKIKKGSKRSYNRRLIQEKLSDFLNTLEIVDDVDEVALQAADYLDNTRGKREDIIELAHQKL